jgi:propanediol dehydratase small subunit
MKKPAYPLMQSDADLRAASGRSVSDITLESLSAGELTDDDLRIQAETLRAQAQISLDAGYPQLAANLRRAAELAAVPNDELIRMYEVLRPGRAAYEQMLNLAEWLEKQYQANETAAFVREAAEVYRKRNLTRG